MDRLYGVLTLQAYAYFERFTHDRPLYKYLVCNVPFFTTVTTDDLIIGDFRMVSA